MNREIQINQDILRRFSIIREKGRLAHAYLFIGPSNSGKGETAFAVAKMLICENKTKSPFCDACPSCLKINSGNHPDIAMIDTPFGESIKIEQIRELLNRNRLRPLLASQKIFVIKQVELLTLEAANAFLKTLEEPSAGSLILLTSSVPENIPDTIRSRCHAIYFQSCMPLDIKNLLEKEFRVGREAAHFLSHFSQGCMGTAQRLMEDGFYERKNAYLNAFILGRPDDNAVKQLLADKEQTKALLNLMSGWIRDAILQKANVNDERLIHLDRLDDLSRFTRKYSFTELNDINRSITKMHQLLAENLNIKLPLLIIGEQLWNK